MLGCHPEVGILNEDYGCSEFKLFSKRIRGNKLCIPNQIELDYSTYSRVRDALVTSFQTIANVAGSLLGLGPVAVKGCQARLSVRDYEAAAVNLHIFGILRSPTDVIESIQMRGERTRKTSEYRWKRAIEVLHELGQNHATDTVLSIVHFDRLLVDPESVMKRCLEVLGCQYEPSVLDGFKHTPQYRGNTSIDKTRAGAGIDSDLRHPLLSGDSSLARKYAALVESSI